MPRISKDGIKQVPLFVLLPIKLAERFEEQRNRIFASKATVVKMALTAWLEKVETETGGDQ